MENQDPLAIALAIAVGFPMLVLVLALTLSAVVRRIERRALTVALVRAYTVPPQRSTRAVSMVRADGSR